MIVDSHCHLDFESLYEQLDKVLLRADEKKIKYLLTICTTIESFKKIKIIISKFDNVYGTLGIHPHETKNFKDIDSKYIINLKRKFKKIIGIGETGLDFYYNNSDKVIQKKVFLEHIEAASELDIPIIIHTRNAEIETLDILKSETKNSNLKVLIHCFTGSLKFAKQLLKLNCYISVSGIITFTKSEDLVNTVSHIPLENLLVETDSPYLAPIPYRGKPNEPSYIIHTLEKLAEIKNLTLEEMSQSTTNNFLKLFDLQ
jgi:TatD DNase family protein